MKLVRVNHLPDATLGTLELPDGLIHTLERPWIECQPIKLAPPNTTTRPGPWVQPPCGRKGVSCVPPGKYKLELHPGEAFPRTVALVNRDLWVYHYAEDVPPSQKGFARTAVLIHPANWPEELRGCIAPGMSLSQDPIGVLDSRLAFALLSKALENEHELEIVNG